MRQLHPVTMKEKYVASGTYTFYRDGKLLKATEAWTMHRQPDGGLFFRIDYDDRADEGVTVLTEVLCTSDYQVERVDTYQYHNKNTGIYHSVRTSYTRMEGYLQVGRSINNGEREYQEADLPENVQLRPPSFLFDGLLLPKNKTEVVLIILTPTPYTLPAQTYQVKQLEQNQYVWQQEGKPPSYVWVNEHFIPTRISARTDELFPDTLLTKYAHL